MAEFLRTHPLLADAVPAANLPEVLGLLGRRGPPAIALVDFWLGGESAAALVTRLLADCPAARVLVLSGDDEAALAQQARALGAHGFIHKSRPPVEFHRAVTALLRGAPWFPATVPAPLPPAAVAGARMVTPEQLGLTARQAEVLALLLRGLPNKRIAQQLSVAESTVKEHVSAVLASRQVRTRAELIASFHGQSLQLPPAP